MTRKEVLESVLEMDEVRANPEMVEVLEKMKVQVEKKRTSKTPAQRANDELVEKIYNFMVEADKAVTPKEIVETFEISNQKVSALVKKLVDAGRVAKDKEGKNVIYKVID